MFLNLLYDFINTVKRKLHFANLNGLDFPCSLPHDAAKRHDVKESPNAFFEMNCAKEPNRGKSDTHQ